MCCSAEDVGACCAAEDVGACCSAEDVGVCSAGEDGSGDLSEDEHKETVSLDTWLKKPDVVYSCQCKEVKSNGYTYPR